MNVEENGNGGGLRAGSISAVRAPLALAAMEGVLAWH
jgi:hypothetical protein